MTQAISGSTCGETGILIELLQRKARGLELLDTLLVVAVLTFSLVPATAVVTLGCRNGFAVYGNAEFVSRVDAVVLTAIVECRESGFEGKCLDVLSAACSACDAGCARVSARALLRSAPEVTSVCG